MPPLHSVVFQVGLGSAPDGRTTFFSAPTVRVDLAITSAITVIASSYPPSSKRSVSIVVGLLPPGGQFFSNQFAPCCRARHEVGVTYRLTGNAFQCSS